MRRFAGVTSRRGQVWANSDVEDTIVVVGEPELAGNFHGGSKPVRDLANFLSGLGGAGWCHRVARLETSRVYYMNESFFSESEAGKLPQWKRLA